MSIIPYDTYVCTGSGCGCGVGGRLIIDRGPAQVDGPTAISEHADYFFGAL